MEKIIYEYCVLRYVPDIEREEFINVGLMMMSKRYRWMQCALHIDDERLLSFSKNCNIERLKIQLALFTRQDVPFPGLEVEERYRWLAAVKSAIIQTSPSHPGIIPIEESCSKREAISLLEAKFRALLKKIVE